MPDKKLRVCLVVSDFAPRVGGIATFNTALAHALAAHPRVERVLVIALQGQGTGSEETSARLTVRRLPLGGLAATARTLWRELRAARRYDVFHSPNIFPVGFFALLICRYVLRKPFVATFHGTDVLTEQGSLLTRAAKAFVLRHATLATVSDSTRAYTVRRYRLGGKYIPVIYAPLPASSAAGHPAHGRLGFDANDVIVLTVANLVRRKGVDDLIRSLQATAARIKLLVVGDGPERPALEHLVREIGVAARVRFAGRVADTDPYYRVADIFALASRYIKEEGDIEGLGIVLLEAQQRGLPVVATRSGGIPEAVIQGESAIVVDERDTEAFAEAFERLAADPARRRAMGERGAQFVARRFSAARAADEYVSLYESLVHST